jgi:hypothetical protein
LLCQIAEPVDDLLVLDAEGGHGFAQIKHRISVSTDPTSDFASVIEQFAHQFAVGYAPPRLNAGALQQKKLDPGRDRLVLVTGPSSSGVLRIDMPAVLRRIHLPFVKAAANRRERTVLDAILLHAKRGLKTHLGRRPSDSEIREFLRLIQIVVLDLDNQASRDRVAAQRTLGVTVLKSARAKVPAWSTLVDFCGLLASTSSGADRQELQTRLLEAGFNLGVPRSYRQDVKALQQYSSATASLVGEHSRIVLPTGELRIERDVSSALHAEAEKGSLLLIGEPGAGKSGTLAALFQELRSAHRDAVFLAADRIEAGAVSSLAGELRLEHDLVDTLVGWQARSPGFLLIDALDAVRGEHSGQMLRDLIRLCMQGAKRWRVVASIRHFDLRYSSELQELFRGTLPSVFHNPEFAAIRHLHIPRLSADETAQLQSKAPRLHAVIAAAGPDLRELLRVPFNLWLVSELLQLGLEVDQITPLRTQFELLERYWRKRIIEQPAPDECEHLLRFVCQQMLAARALRVPRSQVSSAQYGSFLSSLLSSGLLSESVYRDIITFTHHLLFDYAVARLVLREPPPLASQLASDPDLAVIARPSMTLHFQHLWRLDTARTQFWGNVFEIEKHRVAPAIAKVVGPAVAADMTAAPSDIDLLCQQVSVKGQDQQAAESTLMRLVRCLIATRTRISDSGAEVWCYLLDRVSDDFARPVAYSVSFLLTILTDRGGLSEQCLKTAGKVARLLLAFASQDSVRNRHLVRRALQAVCKTFASDTTASGDSLRAVLVPERVKEYGYEELYWLAEEVSTLAPHDPEVVHTLYLAAFGLDEQRETPVPLFGSQIFDMTSTPKQDVGMARYVLSQHFGDYLTAAPLWATRTIADAMSLRSATPLWPGSDPIAPCLQSFDFDGVRAAIRTDVTGAYWEPRFDHELEHMLSSFVSYIKNQAATSDGGDRLGEIVRTFARCNVLPALWRPLLTSALDFPERLGKKLFSLAIASPVLKNPALVYELGNYLASVFSLLTEEQRASVEAALLSLPDGVFNEQERHADELIRNQLLGCLPSEPIVGQQARTMLAELRSQNAVPPNEPLVSMGGPLDVPWRSAGADEEDPISRRVAELCAAAQAFVTKYLNTPPTLEEAEDALSQLSELRDSLQLADSSRISGDLRSRAGRALTEACSRIARCNALDCQQSVGRFALEVLLAASNDPLPTYDAERDAHFTKHLSAASYGGRVEAAAGLCWLGNKERCCSEAVVAALERLSRDQLPDVRFYVAMEVFRLSHTNSRFVWETLEWFCSNEPRIGVVHAALDYSLARIAFTDVERAARLAKTVLDRLIEGVRVQDARQDAFSILVRLYLVRNDPLSGEVVLKTANSAADHPRDAICLVHAADGALVEGAIGDASADALRHRAFTLFVNIVRPIRMAFDALLTERQLSQSHMADPDRVRAMAETVHAIAGQIYSAARSFTGGHQSDGTDQLTVEQAQRFYREAGVLIDELGAVGLPAATHYLLEALESFVQFGPRDVFLAIGRIVLAGARWGYQYEHQAVELIVKLIERYLAEYRALLAEDSECRTMLRRVLDLFVDAGWPAADRLIFQLDRIFR